MRKFLCALIALLSVAAPVDRLDVANLQPVEAVAIYAENGQVVLETDTGEKGRGDTAMDALTELKQNASAVIYLDTAEYLLIQEGAEAYGEELRPYLKGSVKVGVYKTGDVKNAAKYLEIHGKLPKLRDWKSRD